MDVSIIITGHREALRAAPSLRSASRARALAERGGISVETIYMLDRPDRDTEDQFRRGGDANARLLTADFGDPGLARNAAVTASTGRWIAFLDADDLWGETWIRDAFFIADPQGERIVWHPEINLLFGETEAFAIQPDMEAEDFDPGPLAVQNYWTALCFAPRSALVAIPYRPTVPLDGIGFEDWTWNLEVIAGGLLHKIVPGAVHSIRVKPDGVNGTALSARALPFLGSLHRDILARRTSEGADMSRSTGK